MLDPYHRKCRSCYGNSASRVLLFYDGGGTTCAADRMIETQNSTTALTLTSSSVNLERLPILIATYLPVEICVYYQVVPVDIDKDFLVLGMVDPGDLAALDYVGKMLAFSKLEIQPQGLTFEHHQELIAYYFNNPPAPERLEAYKTEMMNRAAAAQSVQETVEPEEEPEPEEPAEPEPDEETIQQLLNSMLRRTLDESADRIFIELNDNGTCRVRYRQQGILRDLFKELSDAIRHRLILSLKQMVGMEPTEQSSAAIEKIYRGERLLLQLRVIVQDDREAAILNILQGDALAKYQHQQNLRRVSETMAAIQQVSREMDQLRTCLADTVEKVKLYSPPTSRSEWSDVGPSLEALMQKTMQVRKLQQSWVELQKEAG